MNLEQLYTELIIQYSREKEHRCHMEDATVTKRGVNPSCGDDITLELKLRGDVIERVCFHGEGCAISQASTQMLVQLIKNKTAAEAKQLIATFLGMITKSSSDEGALEALGDAIVLQNISNMPARVKCAVLAWHTLEEALKQPSE